MLPPVAVRVPGADAVQRYGQDASGLARRPPPRGDWRVGARDRRERPRRRGGASLRVRADREAENDEAAAASNAIVASVRRRVRTGARRRGGRVGRRSPSGNWNSSKRVSYSFRKGPASRPRSSA